MKYHFICALIGLVFSLSLIFSSVTIAKPDTWTKKADMPTSRGGLSTSVVNGKIYAIGGVHWDGANWISVSTVEEYNPVSNTWTKKADMPTARRCLSTCVANGKIYAIGSDTQVEEYDPVSDIWTKKADMPTARWNLSTSSVNGKIYAIGGASTGNVFSKVEEYDPVSDTWTNKANMPTARYSLSTSMVNGKIYAIGGVKSGFDVPFSTVEEYDPASDTWSTRNKADMPTARGWFSASVVNGKIYTIGGHSDCCDFSTVEEYDPVSNRWTIKADMPTIRNGLSTGAVNEKIYAIGGMNILDRKENALSTVEEYDTGFAGEGVEAKDKLATKWGEIKVNK